MTNDTSTITTLATLLTTMRRSKQCVPRAIKPANMSEVSYIRHATSLADLCLTHHRSLLYVSKSCGPSALATCCPIIGIGDATRRRNAMPCKL